MGLAGQGYSDQAGPLLDTPDFPEVLSAWGGFLTLTVASSTAASYRRRIVATYADIGIRPLLASEDDIVAYLASMPARGSQRGDVLRALKSFYGWACPRYRADDPTSRLKIPRRKYPQPKCPSPEQVRALLRAAFRADTRRGWALMLMANTGCRVSSLVAIEGEDLDFDRSSIYFRFAKGGSPYSVPMNRAAEIAALHLLREGRILPVTTAAVRMWCKHASERAYSGRYAVTPHGLRHFYATQLAQVTDPRTWMRLMNHKSPDLFYLYAHTTDERERVAVDAMVRV